MSEQTARLVDRLRQRLRATIQRITLARAAFGLVVTLGVLAAVWLTSAAIEAGFWLEPTLRSVLVGLAGLVVLGATGYFLIRPLLQLIGLFSDLSEESVAQRIGARYPEVSDRLVNLLHLAEGRRSSSSDEMVDHAVRSLSEEVQPVPFEQIEDFSRARKATRLATLPLIGLLLFVLAAPTTFWNASERLLSPRAAFERPAPFQLHVVPGNTDLVKGDSLRISVHVSGQRRPRTVTLALNNEGEEVVNTIELTPDSAGIYRHTVVNVRQSMRYRVQTDPVETPWYTASVTARPLVRTMQVSLTPPAYTGLPKRRLDPNVGDVTGLPGTRVELDIGLGGPPVDQAFIEFDDGPRDTLSVEAGQATGSFTLRREGHYRIQLRSTAGVPNRAPIRYAMKLRADARPSIVFLAPDPVTDLNEDLQQRLRLRLSDDFGFSRLRLYYRVAERRFGEADTAFSSFKLPLENAAQLDQQIDYLWQLTEKSNLDLVPGDVVAYYVRVWDNDTFAGYKAAQTETQRLRLPSLAEKYEELDQQQEGVADQMENLMQETQSIERQFNELRDELRRKQDADWEDKRQLEQLQQRQKQLESSVNDLSQKMESVTREMEENNLTSPETVELYQELQKVMRDINSPELMDALKQLQKAVQNLNLEQMQEALENFEFNEQQYQERLKRSLELFKQLRAQQKLEEAARRAEDLRKQEERLAEETQKRMDEAENEDTASEDEARPEKKSPETQAPDSTAQTGQNKAQSAEESSTEETSKNAQNEKPGKNQKAQQGQQEERQKNPSNNAQNQKANEQQAESPNEDLAQEQERASEEMKELQQQLQKLRQQMDELRSAPKQKMQELSEELQQQQLPKQMQKNSQQLRKNQMQDALQGQQQMQQQLQQMQQRLQQMQQSMQGQQKQINMAGLQDALENTLTLSQDQEDLRRKVRSMLAESPTLRRFAQNQSELSEGLRLVSDSLQQLAQQIPQMSRAVQRETGNALRQMEEATSALSERQAREASGYQKSSMMHLNELALLLSDLLKQLMNAQGSGGGMSMQQMIKQLQNMADQQQKLNQQIQKLLNDAQGNRLSVDQQERLKQLARQQQKIKQELEQLGRGTDLRDKVLGDLDKIAEQMEKTIQELDRGQQNRRTIERQKQILTRLLDAQKSMRQQGKEKKRQSRQATDDYTRQSPDELSREEQIDRLRRDLIRALETGYAPDYEELIKRYFELLQEQGE